MRVILLVIAVFLQLLATEATLAQTTAQKRAASLGRGMNLSFLENWWDGTKAKDYSDFITPANARKHLGAVKEIADAGYKSVRFPVNFSAWASLKAPYDWTRPEMLDVVDEFVAAAKANKIKIIIDLHHPELDKKTPGSVDTPRVAAIWKRIAERYKDTDPDEVFFELRNEPVDITAEDWRAQAEELIKTIRAVAPRHTLVVGFHDWNSRSALLQSKPFGDPNIIYTFHFYDPFLFTHQGATWAGSGLADVRRVPYPHKKGMEAQIVATNAFPGTWADTLLKSYAADSRPEKILGDLKVVRDWSDKHKVPVFCGEFGSYSAYADEADRCRHAKVVNDALTALSIPSAWWEWEGGFNMFEKGTRRLAKCFL